MILDAFLFTNDLFKKNFNKLLLISSVPFISYVLIYFFFFELPGSVTGTPYSSTQSIQQILNALINVYTAGLFILVTVDIHKGNSKSLINYYFQALYYLPRLFVVAICVGIAVFFGFLLFIIPAIYLYGRLMFSQFYVISDNKGVLESLSMAYGLTNERGWEVIGYLWAITLPGLTILVTIILFFSSLAEQNIHLFMILVYFFVLIYSLYTTIYMYKLFLNLSGKDNELI